MNSVKSWNQGLELARCSAIALVVYAHGRSLLYQNEPFKWFMDITRLTYIFRPAWWGVMIFFALSGYLIGRQAIGALSTGTIQKGYLFILRRWLRTVPTYWILLFIACLLGGIPLLSSAVLKNAVFLQTVFPIDYNKSILDVAWSLVVEEWAYALLSALIICSALVSGKRSNSDSAKLLLYMTLFLMASATALRFWACSHEWINWDILKKTATLQFDALSAGICLASLEILRPNFFKQVIQFRWHLSIAAALSMTAFGAWLSRYLMSTATPTKLDWQIMGAMGYPAGGIISVLFLLSLWNINLNEWPNYLNSPVKTFAKISYSLYLVHFSVAGLASKFSGQFSGIALFFIYLFVSTAAGWIGWALLELPFLRIRNQLPT